MDETRTAWQPAPGDSQRSGTLSRELHRSGRRCRHSQPPGSSPISVKGPVEAQPCKRSFLSPTFQSRGRVGLRGPRMHCNMWAVAHTVRELEMNPGSSVLPLALEEFDVLAFPSAVSHPAASSPGRPPSDWIQSRMQSPYCPHSLPSPQTIPLLFLVCGLLCYAYSNTTA